jgi:hypothetical protein
MCSHKRTTKNFSVDEYSNYTLIVGFIKRRILITYQVRRAQNIHHDTINSLNVIKEKTPTD